MLPYPLHQDRDTVAWLTALREEGPEHRAAIMRLQDLLLRAARFEVSRRRATLPDVRAEELEELAIRSADDALVAVLAKLADFDGAGRFTTWAYKFALLETATRLRCRAWRDREVTLEPEAYAALVDDDAQPGTTVARRALPAAVRQCIAEDLTPHQRQVVIALAIDGVPIDVLAARLDMTRGVLYARLHDARRQLRTGLAKRGLTIEPRLAARPGATEASQAHQDPVGSSRH